MHLVLLTWRVDVDDRLGVFIVGELDVAATTGLGFGILRNADNLPAPGLELLALLKVMIAAELLVGDDPGSVQRVSLCLCHKRVPYWAATARASVAHRLGE